MIEHVKDCRNWGQLYTVYVYETVPTEILIQFTCIFTVFTIKLVPQNSTVSHPLFTSSAYMRQQLFQELLIRQRIAEDQRVVVSIHQYSTRYGMLTLQLDIAALCSHRFQ